MSVNQNHTYGIDKIKTEFTAQQIGNWIWDAFLPFMELGENLYRTIQIPEDLPEFVAREGEERLKYGLHKYRERDPKLVERKKQESIAQNKLFCECCDFDFAKAYPTHGEGFIECHHKLPISQGERITKLEDLALVCSNCHRMLHKKCKGQYLTIEELKNIIAK
jgi:predicted HNH restriction endonuclease